MYYRKFIEFYYILNNINVFKLFIYGLETKILLHEMAADFKKNKNYFQGISKNYQYQELSRIA